MICRSDELIILVNAKRVRLPLIVYIKKITVSSFFIRFISFISSCLINSLQVPSFRPARINFMTNQMTGLEQSPERVLVTGGSGFVASHLILQLLKAGYCVHTTIRKPSREQQVRDAIQQAGIEAGTRLVFFVTDLIKDDGWREALTGCKFVHHVASPFPATSPKDENELIRPARDGTLRVLRLARETNAKRVIMTSSFAAIGYGYEQVPLFTESHWTVLDGPIPAYHKSKTLAEQSAWEFMRQEGADLELTVINPTGVFGPVLSEDFSTSIEIIKNMLNGNIPGCPRLSFGIVDVRDLADLHIRAMISPAANSQRFIGTCDNGPVAMIDIARILREKRPQLTDRLPSRELPNWLVHAIALFRPGFRGILPELGVVKRIDNTKAKELLGWQPRSIEECIVDTADSLVKFGVV